MKIGLDIDNVIANTFQDLIPHFNSYMKTAADPIQVIRMMRRQRLKMLGYYFYAWKNEIMTQVSLIEGAAETIRAWHKNHQIKLVTSRLFIFNRQTHAWLKRHNIPYHELHHAREKTKHQKAPDCQIFIEDNLDECEILADHCEQVFLLDHPWNRRPSQKENIIRVSNWAELKSEISRITCR